MLVFLFWTLSRLIFFDHQLEYVCTKNTYGAKVMEKF